MYFSSLRLSPLVHASRKTCGSCLPGHTCSRPAETFSPHTSPEDTRHQTQDTNEQNMPSEQRLHGDGKCDGDGDKGGSDDDYDSDADGDNDSGWRGEGCGNYDYDVMPW